jgi:methyltransferase
VQRINARSPFVRVAVSPAALTALLVLVAVGAMMLLEAALSRHNEKALRARGAIEPPDDVYAYMRIAYPLGFVLIAAEGSLNGVLPRDRLLWGVAVFTLAKALKYWVIATLGSLWSFRVLVLRGQPLVRSGPYRYLRHPNYAAVLAEYVGVALMLSAPLAGLIVTVGFGGLLWRRIQVEERALGLRHE